MMEDPFGQKVVAEMKQKGMPLKPAGEQPPSQTPILVDLVKPKIVEPLSHKLMVKKMTVNEILTVCGELELAELEEIREGVQGLIESMHIRARPSFLFKSERSVGPRSNSLSN